MILRKRQKKTTFWRVSCHLHCCKNQVVKLECRIDLTAHNLLLVMTSYCNHSFYVFARSVSFIIPLAAHTWDTNNNWNVLRRKKKTKLIQFSAWPFPASSAWIINHFSTGHIEFTHRKICGPIEKGSNSQSLDCKGADLSHLYI